jgi:hypothetical protein
MSFNTNAQVRSVRLRAFASCAPVNFALNDAKAADLGFKQTSIERVE